MHGYLSKRRRLEIPQCVRTEILDIAPESNGDYVGFKEVNHENLENSHLAFVTLDIVFIPLVYIQLCIVFVKGKKFGRGGTP
jgi:hypothetical protein